MTSSITRRVAIGVLLAAAAAQLVRPERSNPPIDPARTVEASTAIPGNVAAILKRSCYDCHSNATRWPWYSAVEPMAWGVSRHVTEGRSTLNFSEWGTYRLQKRVTLLEKLCDEVRETRMPLSSYLLLHRDARLSEVEWKAVCDWSMDEADRAGNR
jgi:hypothetical protein